jgi:hypothetical protein
MLRGFFRHCSGNDGDVGKTPAMRFNGGGRTQFHNVSNDAHNQETHADCLTDAQEFALVGYIR